MSTRIALALIFAPLVALILWCCWELADRPRLWAAPEPEWVIMREVVEGVVERRYDGKERIRRYE